MCIPATECVNCCCTTSVNSASISTASGLYVLWNLQELVY